MDTKEARLMAFRIWHGKIMPNYYNSALECVLNELVICFSHTILLIVWLINKRLLIDNICDDLIRKSRALLGQDTSTGSIPRVRYASVEHWATALSSRALTGLVIY